MKIINKMLRARLNILRVARFHAGRKALYQLSFIFIVGLPGNALECMDSYMLTGRNMRSRLFQGGYP